MGDYDSPRRLENYFAVISTILSKINYRVIDKISDYRYSCKTYAVEKNTCYDRNSIVFH